MSNMAGYIGEVSVLFTRIIYTLLCRDGIYTMKCGI